MADIRLSTAKRTKSARPICSDFWTEEYENYDARFRHEAIAPIQNKLGRFGAPNGGIARKKPAKNFIND
jgi:hypothetical protein